MLSRRRFLSASVAAAAGLGLTACRRSQGGEARPVATSTSAPAAASSTTTLPNSAVPTGTATAPPTAVKGSATDDRVLVVVQLTGGNDGLNTLIPLDGRYHDLRPTIGLSDESLVALPGSPGFGLHPSLTPLQDLLGGGRLAVVPSLGYSNPGRSHFVALDNWWSATPGRASQTGWLGRYLDLSGGRDQNPLRAVALGAGVPALTGLRSQPTVVLDPATFGIRTGAASRSSLIDAWKQIEGARAVAAVQAVDVFGQLSLQAAAGTDEKEGGDIAQALATAAELIIAGKGAKVIHITTGGFDTHSGQLATQAALLEDLAKGIVHFNARLAAAGMADRALVMTTSEFGRRAKENGSGGTDHGKAGVQFLVGPLAHGGLIGATDLANLDDGDVKPTVDVRSLYRTALDWLGAPSEDVLGGRFDDLGILR
jgi:uncharacterized protein (DUF1501 family)